VAKPFVAMKLRLEGQALQQVVGVCTVLVRQPVVLLAMTDEDRQFLALFIRFEWRI